jgi:phage-related tail protein
MNDVAQIGRKAFMAYVEAGQLAASHMDKLVRAQAAHVTSFNREAGEAFTAMIDNGIKTRETARQAALEVLEASIPAGK